MRPIGQHPGHSFSTGPANDGFVTGPDLHGGVLAFLNERRVLGMLISALNGDN
jgi:hypothetical protein